MTEGELIEEYPEDVRGHSCLLLGFGVGLRPCKGEMKRGHAPFSVDRNGYHVRWDAGPAWVCEQYGEACFEAAEVERIQRSLAALDAEVDAA